MNPIKLFYSYCVSDEDFRMEIEKSLVMLQRYNNLESWHFRKILPGRNIDESIDKELENADIIVFLVSRDFLASNYCYDIEVRRAMEKYSLGKVEVIPIILRECDWQHASSPFRMIEALPNNARPISQWEDKDSAYNSVTQGLKVLITEINKKKDNFFREQISSESDTRHEIDNVSDTLRKAIEVFKQEAESLNYNSSKDDFQKIEI